MKRLTPVFFAVLAFIAALAATTYSQEGRVFVLGFDGVDPGVVDELMSRGALPRLASLAEKGDYRSLATTNPAESPVSWASFTVGGNPGKTGIFDFLHRLPDSYIPDIALVERSEREILAADGERALVSAAFGATAALVWLLASFLARWSSRRGRRLRRAMWWSTLVVFVAGSAACFMALDRYVPRLIPQAKTARHGTPFWEHAGAHGHFCSVVQVPVTFPAEPFPSGELLSGLGTPDVRATWGTFAVYAEDFPETWSDPVNDPPRGLFLDGVADSVTGGKMNLVNFRETQRGSIKTNLYGPRNFTAARDAKTGVFPAIDPNMDIAIDRESDTATFTVANRSVAAKAGAWTEWLRVEFKLNALISIHGIVRFRVNSVSPKFSAYATPISFDPSAKALLDEFAVPLSTPREFASELAARNGLYETVGWAIATNPLKDELIDEGTFLEDMWFTFEKRWQLVKDRLVHGDARLNIGVMLATDRVQHMFWRYRNPEHPLYNEAANARDKDAIASVYRRMDSIVGEVLDEVMTDGDELWVISDHGFASFDKGVHINSWLVENGYMTLIDPAVRERGRLADIAVTNPFGNVDWKKTRAYSLGLGKIYLNRRGREPLGIIETPEEADALMDEIIARFEAFRDPETKKAVVHRVYKSREIFSGPHAHEAADLIVGFEKGYRVSWDTAAGRAPEGLLETNLNKWSGDHCSVDPSLVPGVVFTNRKITVEDPSIIDMARTILTSLAVEIPVEVEGRDLLGR